MWDRIRARVEEVKNRENHGDYDFGTGYNETDLIEAIGEVALNS